MKSFLIEDITLLFANLKAIERHAYQAKISYFEKNEINFQYLDIEDTLEASFIYFDALFETGNFILLIDKIDMALINCVDCNWSPNIKAIYIELIFKKAASYYNTEQYAPAVELCRELLKINPKHLTCQELFRRVLANPKPKYILRIHTLGVVVLLLAATFTTFDIFLIKARIEYVHLIIFRMIEFLFILGILSSIAPDLIHYFKSRHRLKSELLKIKKLRGKHL
jgi:hypothetical protein